MWRSAADYASTASFRGFDHAITSLGPKYFFSYPFLLITECSVAQALDASKSNGSVYMTWTGEALFLTQNVKQICGMKYFPACSRNVTNCRDSRWHSRCRTASIDIILFSKSHYSVYNLVISLPSQVCEASVASLTSKRVVSLWLNSYWLTSVCPIPVISQMIVLLRWSTMSHFQHSFWRGLSKTVLILSNVTWHVSSQWARHIVIILLWFVKLRNFKNNVVPKLFRNCADWQIVRDTIV